MKNIRIITTSKARILAIEKASDIEGLLEENEQVTKEWFYKQPNELQSFLNEYPDKLQYFLEGFSYWIIFKVKGYVEDQNRYGELKRTIQKFSKNLFEDLRGLASRIAKQVKMVIKSKRIIYKEQRRQKQISRKLYCLIVV